MRRSTLAALLLLAVSVPTLATEANPSPRQRQLIEKLLDTMNVNAAAATMMDAVMAQVQKQVVDAAEAEGNDPEEVAEAKEIFTAFRERMATFDFATPMREEYIRIYARHFTEKELEDLLAFYATPTGRKSITEMAALAREGAVAGTTTLSPKIQQAMQEVMAAHEKKRPWRGTMSNLRSIATALEAYALDHDELYPEGDLAALKPLLVPTYLKELPEKDVWGTPYAYVVSPDHKHYRLVSAGADANFEWDSRRIVAAQPDAPTRYRERLEDDLIFADGSFVQAPLKAKPKDDE